MALKEQANKKKTPRNQSSILRDGTPLEAGSIHEIEHRKKSEKNQSQTQG